jgi:hypothetical protein
LNSQKFRRLHNDFISFLVISQGFWGWNPKYKGGKLITLFWMNKALRIEIDHWALEVLNFEFLFGFESC